MTQMVVDFYGDKAGEFENLKALELIDVDSLEIKE